MATLSCRCAVFNKALGIGFTSNFSGAGFTQHGKNQLQIGHVVAQVVAGFYLIKTFDLAVLTGGDPKSGFCDFGGQSVRLACSGLSCFAPPVRCSISLAKAVGSWGRVRFLDWPSPGWRAVGWRYQRGCWWIGRAGRFAVARAAPVGLWSCSSHPVFKFQMRHVFKMARVVGDQNQLFSQGVGGDLSVKLSHRAAVAL